ncbi:polynucleotide adenylyltransferase PcnB [Stagnimonas aquatica]|uniref:Poly(A) polymerase I n=1 Tax=Stagnimonas aquatica TaxID=2689987 RepID=A0A3N0V5N2_9GAMM|nr:polynucleotide adenylyltransferase PcnB [Stagnimonas aquatica]ROH87884.1 polynucleotide adenylyltransferase PcnB [Stagnimonas aquatica]
MEPRRIPREDHPVSRKLISPAALKVLYGLRDAGHEAHLVGGAVRDILAGIEPKDFDIATSAHPEEMRRVFRNARLIGRRFVIAHVRFGDEIIEVTTFRGAITDSHERDETGRILSDNQYGNLESDAFRRDFTVNALYYDIRDYSVVDYVGGVEDVQDRVLRLIGDPELRYREDPVRMLRAVRISNKLGFDVEPNTAEPIYRLAPLLREIPPARLFDEIIKLLMSREAVANFRGLRAYGLYGQMFPDAEATLQRYPAMAGFVERALANTAARIEAELPVTPAFLYAALLWPVVAERFVQLQSEQGHHPNAALAQASNEAIARACQQVTIPKRFSLPMQEIWELQPRFDQLQGNKPKRLLAHPRFRAAYDFLVLRAETGDADPQIARWWTAAQSGAVLPEQPDEGGDDAPEVAGAAPPKKRRRRSGRRRGGAPADA